MSDDSSRSKIATVSIIITLLGSFIVVIGILYCYRKICKALGRDQSISSDQKSSSDHPEAVSKDITTTITESTAPQAPTAINIFDCEDTVSTLESTLSVDSEDPAS